MGGPSGAVDVGSKRLAQMRSCDHLGQKTGRKSFPRVPATARRPPPSDAARKISPAIHLAGAAGRRGTFRPATTLVRIRTPGAALWCAASRPRSHAAAHPTGSLSESPDGLRLVVSGMQIAVRQAETFALRPHRGKRRTVGRERPRGGSGWNPACLVTRAGFPRRPAEDRSHSRRDLGWAGAVDANYVEVEVLLPRTESSRITTHLEPDDAGASKTPAKPPGCTETPRRAFAYSSGHDGLSRRAAAAGRRA